MTDLALEAPTVSERETLARVGNDSERLEQWPREARVRRTGIDERFDAFVATTSGITNFNLDAECAHRCLPIHWNPIWVSRSTV